VALPRRAERERSIEGVPILACGALRRANRLQRPSEREVERRPEFADGVRVLGLGEPRLVHCGAVPVVAPRWHRLDAGDVVRGDGALPRRRGVLPRLAEQLTSALEVARNALLL